MGILTFGLLGVAALFPVGQSYVLKATKYDRAAAVGQAAFNEIKTRGLLPAFDRDDPNDPWVLLPRGTSARTTLSSGQSLPPFQFDPLATRPMLPPTAMKWVTLWTLTRPLTSPTNRPSIPLKPVVRAAMERIFLSRDDLVVTLPDDRDQPSVQVLKFAPSGGTPIERQYLGDFSWMFTVVPTVNLPDDDLYLVSVVVFYKRNTDGERTVRNISGNGGTIAGGFGGGEITLPTDQVTNVRPNDWLMLSSEPATGQPSFFRWYRILSVAEVDDTRSAISIVGPDWSNTMNTPANASSGTATVVNVSLFDTVIAVYEKTMRIDGPSLYSVSTRR